MSNTEPHDSVSKSLRALLVLATHESMGVSELSRELDVAVSTAHRLLNIMRLHDFVEQNMDNRRYRLGPAARKLGETSYRDGHLVAAGRPHLENLRNVSDETVNLVALDGRDALFLDGIQSKQHLRVATRTGARLPAYATAGGKVLLSRLPRSFVHNHFPTTLDRVTRFTISDRSQLEIELELVRAQGFAINFGEHLADVCAVAVPVLGIHDEPVAALTMAAPLSRWTRRRLAIMAPTLASTATAITRDLRSTEP